MKFKLPLAFAALAVSLAGCFTSATPLLTAATADFPFQDFVYELSTGVAGELVRQGDAYSASDDPGASVLLKAYDDGLYFLQVTVANSNGQPQAVYAVAKVDTAKQQVLVYRLLARPEDLGTAPGQIAACTEPGTEQYGCLTDPQQMIDFVKGIIAAGGQPDIIENLIRTDQ